jgi:hypothetical protein
MMLSEVWVIEGVVAEKDASKDGILSTEGS